MTIPEKCPWCGTEFNGDRDDWGYDVYDCGSIVNPKVDYRQSRACKRIVDIQNLHSELFDAVRKVVEYYDNKDEGHSIQEMDLRIKNLQIEVDNIGSMEGRKK